MIITAASFPTPHLIKKTSNPALWDQQSRFAEFGEALRLPQDIDVMAYAAGQQAFYEHVGRTRSTVVGASTPVAAGQAAVRTQDRVTGLERG